MSDDASVLEIQNAADGLLLRGEVDGRSSDRLHHELDVLLDLDPSRVIRLDFSAVEFMDSSGLRVLLDVTDRARTENGDIVLAELQPAVTRLLELSSLDTHFTVESSSTHPPVPASEPDGPVA